MKSNVNCSNKFEIKKPRMTFEVVDFVKTFNHLSKYQLVVDAKKTVHVATTRTNHVYNHL